jgi:acetolactate decarboxylase
MKERFVFLLLPFLLSINCSTHPDQKTGNPTNPVRVVGMMRKVMMQGELSGTIALDTIPNKEHLYGLGPEEFLTGEILILDGISYKSVIKTDTTMSLEETFQIKAPFFAYANIAEWVELKLPNSIQSMQQLEFFLQQTTTEHAQPFFFRLNGIIEKTVIHVVNLPAGSTVTSAHEAHVGQRNFALENQEAEILGFYSTQHKAIFTHHDTFLHMHLITTDRKWMGHVDYLSLKPEGLKLYLPKNN